MRARKQISQPSGPYPLPDDGMGPPSWFGQAQLWLGFRVRSGPWGTMNLICPLLGGSMVVKWERDTAASLVGNSHSVVLPDSKNGTYQICTVFLRNLDSVELSSIDSIEWVNLWVSTALCIYIPYSLLITYVYRSDFCVIAYVPRAPLIPCSVTSVVSHCLQPHGL